MAVGSCLTDLLLYGSHFSGVQRSAFLVSLAQCVKQEGSMSVVRGHTVMEPVGPNATYLKFT